MTTTTIKSRGGKYTVASRDKVVANGRQKHLPGATPRDGELLIREQVSSHGNSPLSRGDVFFAIIAGQENTYWVARSVGKSWLAGSDLYVAMHTYLLVSPAPAEIAEQDAAETAKIMERAMNS